MFQELGISTVLNLGILEVPGLSAVHPKRCEYTKHLQHITPKYFNFPVVEAYVQGCTRFGDCWSFVVHCCCRIPYHVMRIMYHM